jgi:ribosomal protein S18 acetylase RimI-like enzyme
MASEKVSRNLQAAMKIVPYLFRKLETKDEAVLYDMLYQAIFVPEGGVPPARDIVYSPELSKYVKEFGKPDDLGYGVFDNGEPVGAVWLRRLRNGYGHVNDETPELTIAVMPDYRGRGVGTVLLEHLLNHAKEKYKSVSLSVWQDNPALHLYQRFGFEIVKELQDEVVMLKKL